MATKKKFMREPKMMTTEPSVDEVGMGMKKGGKTKKMAMGGNPMAGYPARPRARMTPSPAMGRASMQQPMAMGSVPASVMRKKGGEVESKAVHKSEMKAIGKVEKELKSHESKSASKAHKGLKMGGSSKYAKNNTPGGLLGGISATRANKKGTTGGIELTGYKNGGTALAAKGDSFQARSAMKPKIDINDKVVSARTNKKTSGSTGKVANTVAGGKPAGFKKGGSVTSKGMAIAKTYMTKINTACGKPAVKGKTGSIEGSKFKNGGHATMTCKKEGGFTQMKKMAKC
jgi:hypothetical protein